jgi:hypothetical protein
MIRKLHSAGHNNQGDAFLVQLIGLMTWKVLDLRCIDRALLPFDLSVFITRQHLGMVDYVRLF